MGYREWYPQSRPVETDRGLRARSKRGEFTKSWWAARWISALERLVDTGRLRRGKRYARQGQVLSLEEQTGGVRAKVQGSRSRPYRVEISLSPLSDAAWDRVMEALSERAAFAARLLSGEMPRDIEEAFRTANASLFPVHRDDLATYCSCPDPAEVCKHVAAVHYLLAERFDEDPFLLFRLRGRTEEQVTRALRAGRGGDDERPAAPEPQAPPLEEELDRFWGARPSLNALKISTRPPTVPLSVLRRLGQPGFVGEDLTNLLGPAYEEVSRRALKTALGEE